MFRRVKASKRPKTRKVLCLCNELCYPHIFRHNIYPVHTRQWYIWVQIRQALASPQGMIVLYSRWSIPLLCRNYLDNSLLIRTVYHVLQLQHLECTFAIAVEQQQQVIQTLLWAVETFYSERKGKWYSMPFWTGPWASFGPRFRFGSVYKHAESSTFPREKICSQCQHNQGDDIYWSHCTASPYMNNQRWLSGPVIQHFQQNYNQSWVRLLATSLQWEKSSEKIMYLNDQSVVIRHRTNTVEVCTALITGVLTLGWTRDDEPLDVAFVRK